MPSNVLKFDITKRLEMHLLGGLFVLFVFVGLLFMIFFVASKTKWLVVNIFFCLKSANAKMLNTQNFGLRLTELMIHKR